MALAANTAAVQILDDNAGHVIAKLQFFQHTANTTSHENSVQKINADALVGRTQTLVGTTVPPADLWAGDELYVTANNLTKAYLIGETRSANTIRVVLANSAAVIANNDEVTFTRANTTWTITNGGGTDREPAKLIFKSASWSVAGNTATRVALEWGGTPNTEIIQFGTGSGYVGRNNLGTAIPNDANAATGHVLASTYSTPALSGYTIIVEFGKGAGFAQRPIY
jgi:hypothetical protein